MKFILFIYLKTSRMKVNWKRVALYVLRIIEMVITGAAGGAITQLSSLTRGHGLCASALNSLTEDGGVVTSHLNFYENYHIDHYSLLGGTAQPDVERATD